VTTVGIALFAGAALAFGFTFVTVFVVLFRPRARRAGSLRDVRLLVLRPFERIEEAEAARLRETHRAASGTVDVVACVPSEASVTVPLPERTLLAASGIDDHAPKNRKVMHLDAGLRLARERGLVSPDTVIVQVDGDVALRPFDLDALAFALRARAHGGLAFAAPVPHGGERLAAFAARAVIAGSPHAFAALWALARVTKSPPAIAGKLVAFEAKTLDGIGGYAAIADAIADDIALVERVHARGGPVFLSSRAAITVDPSRTVAKVLAQLTRWVQVATAHRPGLLVTYPLLMAPLPLLVPLAAWAHASGEALAWAVPLAVLAARSVLVAALARGPYRGRAPALFPLAPLAVLASDALLFAAFVRALRRGPIVWAGRRYDVAPGGRIRGCAVCER
jgi:hypothetical protein